MAKDNGPIRQQSASVGSIEIDPTAGYKSQVPQILANANAPAQLPSREQAFAAGLVTASQARTNTRTPTGGQHAPQPAESDSEKNEYLNDSTPEPLESSAVRLTKRNRRDGLPNTSEGVTKPVRRYG